MCTANIGHLEKSVLITEDGEISWTMTSNGHFFSKWANFRGHLQRVTSHVQFNPDLVTHLVCQKIVTKSRVVIK